LRGTPDPAEMPPAIVAEDGRLLVDKDFAEAVDRAQRRAEVVRDRVRERGELFVGRVHLGNPLLELAVELTDLAEQILVPKDERKLLGEDLHELEILLGEERRAVGVGGQHAIAHLAEGDRRGEHGPQAHRPRALRKGRPAPVFDADHRPLLDESRPQDRKSTRLNSSHSQISYAVFCLKKKIKNSRSNPPITPPWTT